MIINYPFPDCPLRMIYIRVILTNHCHLLIFLTDDEAGAGDLTSEDATGSEVDLLQHNL